MISSKFWRLGLLHPGLSGVRYRVPLIVNKKEARAIHEIAASVKAAL